MNILAIVIADSIGIFLALSVLNISYMDRRGNDPDSRLLTALLVISFSCCLMEMVSFLVDGKASGICVAMVWITNTWLYLGNPLFEYMALSGESTVRYAVAPLCGLSPVQEGKAADDAL